MKYVFNEEYSLSIEERILQINSVSIDDLSIDDISIGNEERIDRFKEKLLSYKDKRFFIVGDYDCDGICATSIIKKLFEKLNIQSNYYITSRIKDGYGLNRRIVDTAASNGFDCLLCVDNGIAANDCIDYANGLGLKVFIIDHHEYQFEPNCEAFIHSNILSNVFNDMCAAGLCALLSNSFEENDFATALGGLATLADMVSVFNYNRYLVQKMISIIKKGTIMPINLLLGNNEISYANIHYNVIPKINAVSRLGDLMNVNYVVKYLLAEGNECLKYYDKIENINSARKNYSKQMCELANELVDSSQNVIVIHHKEFKEGLCGLVANRLLNDYAKPVIVFADVDGVLKGSGRSVAGTNLYSYLKNIDYLFDSFGGHELAVGISMKVDNYDKFIEYVNSHALEYNEQVSDVLVIEENDINDKLLSTLDRLQPFGTNFKEPLFALKKPNIIKSYIVGNKYPKYDITSNLSAISFNSKLMNKSFEYMIGHVQKDNFYPTKFSFVIEDLV